MWNNNDHEITIFRRPCKGFLTPPPASSNNLKPLYSPMSECKQRSSAKEGNQFHVIHKVPAGNSPYVRAKHVQLIEKDPSRAISLFWSAINAGDRVDSALKDMAIVMKQLDRSDEAIEAIKSFRHLCPNDSQESIDNVLVELYKRAGRIEEEIEMLQEKLKCIEEGTAFGGKRVKAARSQGKKIHITIEQEKARILGNLAWAYLQQNNYITAEEYYRKALFLESDKNKQCNLAICLMHMNRIAEAKSLLQSVSASSGKNPMDEAYAKSFKRACELLAKLEMRLVSEPLGGSEDGCKETSLSSPTVPRWSEDSRQQETYRLREQITESYCGSQFESNVNFKANIAVHDDAESSRFMSFREGSCLKYTQPVASGSKLKNDYFKSSSEWRSPFSSLKKTCTDTSGTEASSCPKKTYFSPAPARFNVRTPFTQPRRCLWGFSDGDQRKAEQWRKHVVGNSKKNPSNDDDWTKRKSWDNSDMKKSTNNESNLSQDLTIRSQIVVGQPITETPKPRSDSSNCNKKKSWADMVEEDEDEEICGFYYNQWKSEEAFSDPNIINGSPCLQTQMKSASQKRECIWGWKREDEEEFNDENMNSNTIYESPYLQTQMKNVSRKLEFCDPKDETSPSSPENSAWSRNHQRLRRSLCFDQNDQKRRDPLTAYSCPPIPRKDLKFGDIKLLRRNRLKVFQDITRHPESP